MREPSRPAFRDRRHDLRKNPPAAVRRDLNADGTVDDTDLTLWMNAFDLVIP